MCVCVYVYVYVRRTRLLDGWTHCKSTNPAHHHARNTSRNQAADGYSPKHEVNSRFAILKENDSMFVERLHGYQLGQMGRWAVCCMLYAVCCAVLPICNSMRVHETEAQGRRQRLTHQSINRDTA